MADNDISVRISADIGDLVAKLQAAKTQIQAFVAGSAQLADQVRTAAASSQSASNSTAVASARSAQVALKSQQQFAQLAFQIDITELDREVAAGEITAADKIEQEKQIVQAKGAAQQQALQAQLQADAVGSASAAKTSEQMIADQERTALQLQKLNLQSVEAQEKVWNDLSNHIGDAFGRVLSDVDMRGQGLGKALKSEFGSLANEIAEDGVKAFAKWGLNGFNSGGFNPGGLLGDLSSAFGGNGAGSAAGGAATAAQTTALTTNTAALTTQTAATASHAATTATAAAATGVNTAATGVNTVGQTTAATASTVNSAATTANTGGLITGIATWIENTVATLANTVATDGLAIVQAIGSILPFAEGGDPPVGVPSLVGERGPELFVPRAAGTVISNANLRRLSGLRYAGLPAAAAPRLDGGLSMSEIVRNVAAGSYRGGDVTLNQTIQHTGGGRQSDAESVYEAAVRGGRRGALAMRRAMRG